ncbi:MAG: hypothetical protein JSS49_06455 [Planctomycetes bacterium]|nr:hypothetical protein [Planctomycetota bacterium]
MSTWLTWTLTFSDDRALASAAVLIFAGGLWVGGRYSLSRFLGHSELAVVACTWALLQPWLSAALMLALQFLPLSFLAGDAPRFMVGLVCAAPCWFVAGWMWSSLASGVVQSHGPAAESAAVWVSVGIALGMAAISFVLAPVMGAWCTVVLAVVLVLVTRVVSAPDLQVPVERRPAFNSTPAFKTTTALLNIASAVAVGGLLAAVIRLVGQLMPNGSQTYFAEWLGIAGGFAIGQYWQSRHSSAGSPWFVVVPAAAGAVLLAILPSLILTSLWATASLTSVFLLMAFRVLLLAGATAPTGFALARLMPVRNSASESISPFNRWNSAFPFAIGFVGTQFSFSVMGLVGVLTMACSILVLIGVVSMLTAGERLPSRLVIGGMVSCCLLGLSVPLWSSNDNPALTSKLLFSTPSFVAYRAGWDSHLLPMLDDARVIDQREGLRGPLTLWRSHGLELHLRENSIPRAVVSANTEMHPQFAPEVLQAIYPLVLVERADRVLVLGASGGVPMASCLQFPVQQVICAEGDNGLIDVIRGPIARETGYDPFTDERAELLTVPAALAVMASSGKYDVILSSPSSSSIVAGAPMFTADHYQRVSRCLAEGGIYCQRFECIDYGPTPLRTVVQSLRQAFQEVMAIETAAGEFLLMGTNTPGIFVPDDLPARLESPHVRRLLARSGLDWSALLNFPAYDHETLGEICAEGRPWTNVPANGILAIQGPLDLMRWGPKLQEVQRILTAVRTSPVRYLNEEDAARVADGELHVSRKSRMLEWLGDQRVSPDVLRRLSEVATQHKLVRENPETHWWEYRKSLREQLQNRPRSKVQQVSHSAGARPLHPEDERRKGYFVALGDAAREPTPEHMESLIGHLQPYDPLVSYFARQEIADIQARGQMDPAAELAFRLHVIYFAPVADASTRNVATALELLVRHPEVIPDPARRFDTVNGLVQTLFTRWETRQTVPMKSARRQLSDVDRSVVAIEKALTELESQHAQALLSDADWDSRKQVVDRILLRPLRAYRSQLQSSLTRSESRTQSVIDQATSGDDER